MNKKIILLIITFLFLTAIMASIYYFYSRKNQSTPTISQPIPEEQKSEKPAHFPCLADDEWATVLPSYWDMASDFKPGGTVNVYVVKKGEIVSDGVLEEEIERQIKEKNRFNFPIPNVAGGGSPPDILKCGVYIVRKFSEPGYELWRYDYTGKGTKFIILSAFDEKGNPIGGTENFYSSDAKVDPTETYVALVRNWVGDSQNHALVIKNLKTMKDEYVITLKELVEKFPDAGGSFNVDYWGEERFGTGDILGFHFDNDRDIGFSINIKTKELKIFRYGY